MSRDVAFYYAHGYYPLRVDFHPFYVTRQLWRLCAQCSAHHAHIDGCVGRISIEVVGWYVNDDALAMISDRLMTAPSAPFHIHHDAAVLLVGVGLW